MLNERPSLRLLTENEYPVLSDTVCESDVSIYEPERLNGLSAGYTKLCERFTDRLFLPADALESVPLNVALVVPMDVARIPETVPLNVAE